MWCTLDVHRCLMGDTTGLAAMSPPGSATAVFFSPKKKTLTDKIADGQQEFDVFVSEHGVLPSQGRSSATKRGLYQKLKLADVARAQKDFT